VSVGDALTRLVTARRSALALALCRIGIGLAALVRGLKSTRDFYWLATDPDVVPARWLTSAPEMTATWQIAAFSALWIVASIGLVIGYRSRACAVVVFVLAVGQQFLDQNMQAHHMDFLVVVLFLIALTDSDAAMSVRAARGHGASTVPAWPVCLLQVQLSIVYFFTAAAKLNEPFLSGQVLLDRLALPTFVTDPAVIRAIATGTVGLEFFLAFGLWIRPLRPWAFALGLVLHGLVPITMGLYAGLIVFSLAVLAIYVLFIDEAWGSKASPYRRPQ